LLRVPLVIHYPARLAPGRESRPVMNVDLFPTVLELAGIVGVPSSATRAVSLLEPREARPRLAEYRAGFGAPFHGMRRRHPDFDASPWQQRLRSLTAGGFKLIQGSDGRRELYHLEDDPAESRNLLASEEERARRMEGELASLVAELEASATEPAEPTPPLPAEDRRRLEALGYGDGSDADAGTVSEARPR
jgi:arylsulfatase A-like enzyme